MPYLSSSYTAPSYFSPNYFGVLGGLYTSLMPLAEQSTLAQIVAAFRARLVEAGVVTDACCRSWLEEEPSPIPGSPFVSVVPGPQSLRDSDFEGGGRSLATYQGVFLARAYVLQRLDPLLEDGDAMSHVDDMGKGDPNLGLFPLQKAVVSALLGWMPTDPIGSLLVEEPVRGGGITRATRYGMYRSSQGDVIWCEIPFRATYLESLSDTCSDL